MQDLKAHLSSLIAEVESGTPLVVTRHNAPVVQLTPARDSAVHRGSRVGAGRITPALKRGTRGRYLTALLEDRGNR